MEVSEPLNVRVARVLGCAPIIVNWTGPEEARIPLTLHCGCQGRDHGREFSDGYLSPVLQNYDTDWSATGPLIERYGIGLALCGNGDWLALEKLTYPYDHANVDGADLYCIDVYGVVGKRAPSPLTAACLLILDMAEQGKLPK